MAKKGSRREGETVRGRGFHAVCSAALLCLLASCASLTSSQPPAAPPPPSASAYHHVLLAFIQEADADPAAAIASYQAALREDPDAPFVLRRIAALLARAGQFSEAIPYAQRAQALRPNEAESLSLLGNIYAASGQMDLAIRTHEQVLTLLPTEIHPYFTLAELYRIRHNAPKVEAILRAGVAAHPDSAFGHYYLGDWVAEKGTPEALAEALGHHERALELQPTLESARLGLARVYERQGRMRLAEETYRNLLEGPEGEEATSRLLQLLVDGKNLDEALAVLDDLGRRAPSNAAISFQKALVLREQKEYARAIETLLPAVTAHPENARLKAYLAALYEENEQYDKAVALYEEILKTQKQAYDLRLRLGAVYFYKLKQPEKALAQGEAAWESDPKRPEAYLFRGVVLYESGRFEEAGQVLRAGIARNPGVADLHFHLGATYDKINRFDDLVAEMEQAIRIDAEHAVALNYLGYTYADRGIRLDEAIDLIQRALALRPEDGYIVDSLGWAYYKKGRLQEAKDALQKAARLAPEDAAIYEHLGEVYLTDLNPEQAKASWLNALRLDPRNEKLRTRFKQAGFGTPALDANPPQVVN